MKRKLVTVAESGVIPELNFMNGPISTPTMISMEAIIKMVTNNRKVYECNPSNPSDQVELTIANVKKENFLTSNSVSKPEEKKVDETPATPVVEPTPVVDEKPVETPATPVVDEKPVETPDEIAPVEEEVVDEPTTDEEDTSEDKSEETVAEGSAVMEGDEANPVPNKNNQRNNNKGNNKNQKNNKRR